MSPGAGYRGAYWHTVRELRAAVATLPLANLEIAGAIFLPGGSRPARVCERLLPSRWLSGGFLVLAADVQP